MDYDDAALLTDQQNWRPWFERGLYIEIISNNLFMILKKHILFNRCEIQIQHGSWQTIISN